MALRAVYSVQIMCLAPMLPSNTVVVPDGVRMIIRDVDAVEVGGSTPAQLVWQGPAGNQLWWATRSAAGAAEFFQWRGRQVFNPGESVIFSVVSGTWDIQVSGYELTLT